MIVCIIHCHRPNLPSFPTRRSSDLDLQQGIAQVRREFERFVELHDQLGRHLDNATKKFDETERALARASGAIEGDRKSTRLNSSHRCISYAVFCLKKKKQ